MKVDKRYATADEKRLLKMKTDDPALKRRQAITKQLLMTTRRVARLVYIAEHGGGMVGRLPKGAEEKMLRIARGRKAKGLGRAGAA